jgi:hypothetical protein
MAHQRGDLPKYRNLFADVAFGEARLKHRSAFAAQLALSPPN